MIYLWPLLEVIGNLPVWSENVLPCTSIACAATQWVRTSDVVILGIAVEIELGVLVDCMFLLVRGPFNKASWTPWELSGGVQVLVYLSVHLV